MKAIQFARYGGPEVPGPVGVADPHPVFGPVHAAGVNGIGWKIRAGYPGQAGELPAATGMDAAGVIDETGGAVFGAGSGALAGHVLAGRCPPTRLRAGGRSCG